MVIRMATGVNDMDIFIDNKYTRWYYSIVNARLASPLDNRVYTESHHIIPESFHAVRSRPGPVGWVEGDPEAPTNKVSLSAREHFICHWLLTKMTTGKERFKMVEALLGMRAENKNQRRYNNAITSRVYTGLKHEHAIGLSKRFSGEGNPNWGNTWTDEQKQAQADKVRGEKNGAKKPGVGARIAAKKNGVKRDPFSQECIDAMSAAKVGEKNNMWGKEVPDERRAVLKKNTERYCWVTNEVIDERVLKTDAHLYLTKGWRRGRVGGRKTGARSKIECPHCQTMCAANTYARFHGDKCKHKK